ncbi:uncharacterized protein LOC133316499 [Gastrolobium bilobum]|uniref:uncharacterized protein LOC133316499 n=1 Tax=Gastrolobium bilobum TaxID=150636 RepID=UPI002AB1089C|nr:uncharacterized protein LOC133316499 [Gastrolobium bilobum]XP_061374242.1 uncharacterized protein LOC133316499 [Gastrolobium bilobum]
MDSKGFKFRILSGSIARCVFFRALFLAFAVSIVSLLRILPTLDLGSLAPKNYVDCVNDSESHAKNGTSTPGSYLFQSRILHSFWGSFDSENCKKDINLTFSVVTELMGKGLLDCGAKSLCIGEGSDMVVLAMQHLGFSGVSGVHKHRLFSFNMKKIVYMLEYQDSSFDFVFSKDVDKVSVPSLLVLEVERILKPGGIGALLVSATSVSSLLRSSSVVHVGYVNEFSLVVFKKRSENTSSFFYHYGLPADCVSVTFTKPLVELMEPLVEETPLSGYEKSISYLPNFVDVSSRKRLVYIDMGVGELLNTDVTDWFPPSYPIDQKAFNVYFVHYNTSILLSYVKQPRVSFVYHPGLAGKVEAKAGVDGDLDPFLGEEEFDFLDWFKETVQHADFVVLKMNAGKVEMKFLSDIFESGAICFVDELFLSCSDSGDVKSKTMSSKEHCMDIYRGLRSNGVYVHQWWDTKLHQGPQVS